MDDLSEKLDRLLSSPDSMKRIEEMMAAFGGTPAASPPPETPPAPPDLPDLPLGDLTPFLKLLPLLGSLQQEDDNAALLHALRPHLGQDRQKRLDEAARMMKLMRLLPLLKEISDTGEESSP